jgi:two-component system, LytTR family, response regulator AlgR
MNADKLTIIIADDEAPARNRLKELLSDIGNTEVLAEAHNGKEALEFCNQYTPDILLLDIRMPVMDGIEAAEHLQKMAVKPNVIFTTAYDTYAIRAFDLNAIDYLLKPIRLERLQTALNKIQTLQPKQLQALKPLQTARSHLSIAERGKIELVPIDTIIFFRAEQKYVVVRTAEREYLIEDSLNQLEQEFNEKLLRLHRNSLVARAFIKGFEKRSAQNEQGQLETQWMAILHQCTETIAVSRRQQHLIKQL